MFDSNEHVDRLIEIPSGLGPLLVENNPIPSLKGSSIFGSEPSKGKVLKGVDLSKLVDSSGMFLGQVQRFLLKI